MAIFYNQEKQFDIEDINWSGNAESRVKLYQVVIFEKGSGVVQLDFEQYPVDSPAMLFISEHQLLSTFKGENVQGKVIQFSNDFFCIKLNRTETFCDAVIFNVSQSPLIKLTSKENNKINFILDALTSELTEPSLYQEEIITSQLKTLLLECSRIKLGKSGQFPVQRLSKTVADFQDLLENHFSKEHQVQFYADRLFISSKGLNTATKRELGKTASELIKEKIIIEAKRELYQGEKTVKEIAFGLGFDDPAYFSRFFKKSTQRSPKEYISIHAS